MRIKNAIKSRHQACCRSNFDTALMTKKLGICSDFPDFVPKTIDRDLIIQIFIVEGNQGYGNTYTSQKVCVEFVT